MRFEVVKLIQHIPSYRLLSVAVSPELEVTADELKHLRVCAACLRQWEEYIRDYAVDRDPVHSRGDL